MLTAKQKRLVLEINSYANKILAAGGGDEAILASLHSVMGYVEELIKSTKHEELDQLCAEYSGFYKVMEVLESMAINISNGNIELSTDNSAANKSSKAKQKHPSAKNADITQELNQVIIDALCKLKKLVDNDLTKKPSYLSVVENFLVGIISTAAELVEINLPGATQMIYARIEAAAKLGGLRGINKQQFALGGMEYSVSDIAPDDHTAGMNYLGQILNTALFKGLHELPMSLRNEEMLLRGIESLLANLLHEKFNLISHQVLDDFCEHVHLCLSDLETRLGEVKNNFYNNLSLEKDAQHGKH